jgi:hypothetical protein
MPNSHTTNEMGWLSTKLGSAKTAFAAATSPNELEMSQPKQKVKKRPNARRELSFTAGRTKQPNLEIFSRSRLTS